MVDVDDGFTEFIKLVEQLWKCDVCSDYQTIEALDEKGYNQIVCLKCSGLKISGIYEEDGHPEYLNIDQGGKFKFYLNMILIYLILLCVKFNTKTKY